VAVRNSAIVDGFAFAFTFTERMLELCQRGIESIPPRLEVDEDLLLRLS
jgi:hypothetical protein